MNFMKNSFRYMKVHELEEAWVLLEEAMKQNKPEPKAQNGKKDETMNENENGHKRKLIEETNDEPQPKKTKILPEEDLQEDNGKFSWGETIRNILSAKNNEIQLKKLRVKIKKKYQNITKRDWTERVEIKFNKKINKLKGIVVEDEKIRLIE